MANKDMANEVERSQATLYRNETRVADRLKTILAKSEVQLETQLRRSWERYQASGKESQLIPAIQARGILAELMPEYGLLDPSARGVAESSLKALLNQSFGEGQTLGDKLLSMAGEPTIKQTYGLPVQALNILAQDATSHLSRYSQDFRERAVGIIGQGLATNQGVGSVARNLREALGTTQSKAEQLVRTESLSATNAGAIKTYRANNLSYFQFLATSYDRRTCGWCVNRNLKVYELGQSQPPIHPGCRCTAMPFNPEWLDSGLYDLEWAKDYRETSLDALKAEGASPNNGLSPFERMNGALNVPQAYWTPGEPFPSR